MCRLFFSVEISLRFYNFFFSFFVCVKRGLHNRGMAARLDELPLYTIITTQPINMVRLGLQTDWKRGGSTSLVASPRRLYNTLCCDE